MPLGVGSLLLSMSLAVPVTQESPEPASWRLPDEALGLRMAPILLLSRPDVRRELELRPDLGEEARGAILSLYAQAAELQGRSGPEVVEARRAVDDSARRWIAEHLSPEQQARLEQLDLQWEGALALISRPMITESLRLTEEQRRQIAAVVQRPASPGSGPIDEHRRRHRDAASILTEEQRLRWLAMLGRPFEPGSSQANRPVPPPR